MHRLFLRVWSVGFVFVAVSAFAGEQDLTVEKAVASALARHPLVLSSELGVRASEAGARQSALRPNPSLELEAENFAGSGEYAGGDALEVTASITQPVELGGKRARRREVAGFERELAAYDLQSTRRDVAASAAAAFYRALAAAEKVDIAAQLIEVADAFSEDAARRVEAGAASPIEQTRAEIERVSATTVRAQAEEEFKAARRNLELAIGADTMPGRLAGDLYGLAAPQSFDDLAPRLAGHPDWSRWDVERSRAGADARLADAERWPDLDIGGGVRRDEGADANALVAVASLPLPIFDRQQGRRAAAQAALARADAAFEAAQVSLRQELAEAVAVIASRHVEAVALRDQVIPAAEHAFNLARDGYRQGRLGYLDVLDAERALFDQRLRLVDVLAEYHAARTDIGRLTGQTP